MPWQFLRDTDPASPDADWAGTNVEPTETAAVQMPDGDQEGRRKIAFKLVAVNSSGVAVNRGTCTFDVALTEVHRAGAPGVPGVQGGEVLVVSDRDIVTGRSLNRTFEIEAHSMDKWSLRCFNWANIPATTVAARIYWRLV